MCNVEGVWRLIGVSSWGEGCTQMRKPQVYTSVAHYMSWVKYTIAMSVL